MDLNWKSGILKCLPCRLLPNILRRQQQIAGGSLEVETLVSPHLSPPDIVSTGSLLEFYRVEQF